ncbi:MAG: hypothetical protein IE913_10585 [Halothiobacillus sp.]|nr:hypothetical protein [Halothiobacillus sp.]
MNRATKTRLAIAVGMAVAATAAYAATQTQLSFSTPQVLSQNDLAYKRAARITSNFQ